jgi:predicted enzyme related to lactoylglutathione lyase
MTTSSTRFIWHELTTGDVAAAKAFYGDVFGWTMTDIGPPGSSYTLLSAGDRGIGGIAAGAPAQWVGYVHVADVDATAAHAVELGGAVRQPAADIPGYGRAATLADPGGAIFKIMAPTGEDRGIPAPTTPGVPSWNELYASDGDAAFDFYSALLGWQQTGAMDMGALGVYRLIASGPDPIGGMMTRPPGTAEAYWLFYFTVPEIKDAISKVEAGGGRLTNKVNEVPGGSLVVSCADPQGTRFALHQPPAAA